MSGPSGHVRQATTAELVAASDVLAYVAPDQIRRSPWVPKVWWAYNQTTPAVIASQGVSSITDDGVGLYTVNFSDAFASAAYAIAGVCDNGEGATGDARTIQVMARAVGALQVETPAFNAVRFDCEYSSAAIWGTLA